MNRVWVTVLVAALTLTACAGDPKVQAAPRRPVEQLKVDLPSELAGLNVKGEDITKALTTVRPSYVKGTALFSLRSEADLVQATLQVNRLKDDERYVSSEFRRTIVNQLGSTPPRATQLGEQTVYRTSGSKLALAVWFDGKSMYLLSIRDDFPRPRTLIRALVTTTTT